MASERTVWEGNWMEGNCPQRPPWAIGTPTPRRLPVTARPALSGTRSHALGFPGVWGAGQGEVAAPRVRGGLSAPIAGSGRG